MDEDSEKTTKNKELAVHYTCKRDSGGSKQTSHDNEAFLLCKKHPEGNYSILALRSSTRARVCQGRDGANMAAQREQFPVRRHFLLTTRRNRNWLSLCFVLRSFKVEEVHLPIRCAINQTFDGTDRSIRDGCRIKHRSRKGASSFAFSGGN